MSNTCSYRWKHAAPPWYVCTTVKINIGRPASRRGNNNNNNNNAHYYSLKLAFKWQPNKEAAGGAKEKSLLKWGALYVELNLLGSAGFHHISKQGWCSQSRTVGRFQGFCCEERTFPSPLKTVTRSGFCLLLNNLRRSCWTDPQKRVRLCSLPPNTRLCTLSRCCKAADLMRSSSNAANVATLFLMVSTLPPLFPGRYWFVYHKAVCLFWDNLQQMVLQVAASQDPEAPPSSLGDGRYATSGDVTSEECKKGGGVCCGTRAVTVAKTHHGPDSVQVFGDQDGCSAL